MGDVRLVVNGAKHGGWKSIRVTRSIESVSGSFALVARNFGDGEAGSWPILEDDTCRVEIDGETIIDGYIDGRSSNDTATSTRLTFKGRDRSAVLVDCSADLDVWTFRNASVLDVARKLAEPFGIRVSVQPGVTIPKAPPRFVVKPGDKAFEAMRSAAAPSGILLVGDGAGGIVLTQAGTKRAAPLTYGENIKGLRCDFKTDQRYYRYLVLTQVAGTDRAHGSATQIRAEAIDEGMRRRKNRTLVIRPEKGMSAADAQRFADWTARIRAARGDAVSITVQGWEQSAGRLWTPNEVTHVTARHRGLDGDMLISEVSYMRGDKGTTAVLKLVRPDAFTPEPRARVKSVVRSKAKSSQGGFKFVSDVIDGAHASLIRAAEPFEWKPDDTF